MKSSNIIVLGAGISGLTTAIVLQSIGYNCTIIAEHAPGLQPNQTPSPYIPTYYAMASAYPHNLQVKNLLAISEISQSIFKYFFDQKNTGIKDYQMFEIFENEPGEAALASKRMNFQSFDGKPEDLKNKFNLPFRPGAEYLWGWLFDTYFADMPEYLPFLWSMFLDKGGILKFESLSLEKVNAFLNNAPVVDCLGHGAIKLFHDSSPYIIMRGRQILVPGAKPILMPQGKIAAYNYTPLPPIFSRANGEAEYVHFFPRSDGWVLGQTRETGSFNELGQWVGEAVNCSEKTIGNQSIPTPIFELNAALLANWVNQTLESKFLIGREGYRYYRDPDETGVRLDIEINNKNPLLHNYGHGGSGITMSWGCSIQVAQLLGRHLDRKKMTTVNSDQFDYLVGNLVGNKAID